MRAKSPTTLLGLALEAGHLSVALVRRSGDRVEVGRTLHARLSLDPLNDDPELFGREVRNLLDAADIRERDCVVCLPLRWALLLRVDLPEMEKADEESYLTVQAERQFPFPVEDLVRSASRYVKADGAKCATVAAIPRASIVSLQKALKAARLRPRSITIGTAAVDPDDSLREAGSATLLLNRNGADLIVRAGGGIAAFRTLDCAAEDDAVESQFDPDGIARDLRITLGQMGDGLREQIRDLHIYGPASRAAALCETLGDAAARLGLTARVGSNSSETSLPLAAASRFARMRASEFEFLIETPSRLQALSNRISSRWAAWAGAAAALLVVLTVAALVLQYAQLASLEREWNRMAPRVAVAEELQSKVREYRAWFTDTPQALEIARKLTLAFPEEGTVWATTLDMTDFAGSSALVSCSGKAQNNEAWLAMLDRLRATPGFHDVQVLQVRDDPTRSKPMQFTLSLQWREGA